MPTIPIPHTIQNIAKKISVLPQKYTSPPLVLLVGGFVRDLVLNLAPKDADMEVYGVDYETLKDLLEQIFPNQIIEAGKSFGVFKIREPELQGESLSNTRIPLVVDVALPRTESKSGQGHREFAVENNPDLSINEALSRRDFTINAIALDPLTGEYIDPYGGQKDIADRILRVVNPQKFIEDPLRVYRALQFVARFNLTVESKTLKLMKQVVNSGELDTLSKERITEEWKKLLLKSEQPSLGLELAKELGIIEKYYPELHILESIPQEPEWHPEGNVWNHSLQAMDVAAKILKERKPMLNEAEKVASILGALLHDIGKAATTQTEEGHIRSRGHEQNGKKLCKVFLKKCTFGKEVEAAVTTVAAEHMKPRQLQAMLDNGTLSKTQYTNAVRRLLKRIYPVPWQVIILVSEADLKGRGRDNYNQPFPAGEVFTKTILENNLEQSAVQTLITGSDIIKTAKQMNIPITPGPQFRDIIQKIEDQRDTGVITTTNEALIVLQKLLSQHASLPTSLDFDRK